MIITYPRTTIFQPDKLGNENLQQMKLTDVKEMKKKKKIK